VTPRVVCSSLRRPFHALCAPISVGPEWVCPSNVTSRLLTVVARLCRPELDASQGPASVGWPSSQAQPPSWRTEIAVAPLRTTPDLQHPARVAWPLHDQHGSDKHRERQTSERQHRDPQTTWRVSPAAVFPNLPAADRNSASRILSVETNSSETLRLSGTATASVARRARISTRRKALPALLGTYPRAIPPPRLVLL